jgi:hypothetical protein
MFKRQSTNWIEFRRLPGLREVDFHWSGDGSSDGYWENMRRARDVALSALMDAQRDGLSFVLFTHGGSTSRIGKTTSRSQVRSLMRSPDATPFIVRRECIQQSTVFVAAIRLVPGLALRAALRRDG